MSLDPGQKLAHYEIVEPIGKGGMGEVYSARDTKLGRDVAIKVLPDEFSRDEERLRRFRREAKVLASLNHPNIASIYGLEQSGETHYLVLELVPGDTLAERIARGPIRIDEALEVATKIAEALEAAHEQGVVHRDLKPANVKLTPDDKVKVLDFGLAKALVDETVESDSSMSPTITRDATRVGTILGTAAYMSPEQAKGKSVDKRTDIFAFGAVLYEMLTGRRAFAGEDVSETLAFVITQEVDWDALPAETPSSIRRLLRRALEKSRRDRLADVADARIEIKDALSAPAVEDGGVVRRRSTWRPALGLALASSIAVGLLVWNVRAPEPHRVARLELTTSEDERLLLINESTIAISPDGNNFIYVSDQGQDRKLIVRPIDALTTRTLVTSTSATMTTPFVSPDGEWVGYRDGNELKKVPLAGGPPVTICWLPASPRGASWGDDDSIVFGTTQRGVGLYRVPASGGEPEVLTTPNEDEARHVAPDVLPGGRGVLFSISGTRRRSFIGVHDFHTGEREVLFEGDCCPRYAASGHIVYTHDESLWAIPFDSEKLELVGESRALPDQVFASNWSANYVMSHAGVLVFVPSDVSLVDRRLVWVDRAGEVTELGLGVNSYTDVDISPDGTKLAVWLRPEGIWVYDVARGARVRISEEGGTHPVWSPDGRRVGFEGPEGLYSRSVGGSEPATLVFRTDALAKPGAWSPHGLLPFAHGPAVETGFDIFVLSENGQAEPLLQTSADEDGPTFSPNGKWLAYVSDESGENEVYLQPYPGPGAKIPISVGGGRAPVWSPKGDELFYRGVGEPRLYAVSIQTEPALSIGEPRMLFEKSFFAVEAGDPHYDVSPDGQRFLMIESASDRVAAPRMIVVLNWFDELKRLVPTDK